MRSFCFLHLSPVLKAKATTDHIKTFCQMNLKWFWWDWVLVVAAIFMLITDTMEAYWKDSITEYGILP